MNFIFSEKLEAIFNHFGLNSSDFADKIQVQRSTISHLLSNRNKPSLDFILKVIEHYPSLNLHWLVGLSEQMLQSDVEPQNHREENTEKVPVDSSAKNTQSIPISEKKEVQEPINTATNKKITTTSSVENDTKKVHKIVFFYSDRSFEIFEP